MVKIKDFTLASKNRGGGHVPPSSYTPPAHVVRRALSRILHKLFSPQVSVQYFVKPGKFSISIVFKLMDPSAITTKVLIKTNSHDFISIRLKLA